MSENKSRSKSLGVDQEGSTARTEAPASDLQTQIDALIGLDATTEINDALDAVIRSAWERGKMGQSEGASDASVDRLAIAMWEAFKRLHDAARRDESNMISAAMRMDPGHITWRGAEPKDG